MRKIVYPRAGGVETIEIVEDSDPVPRSDQVCVRIHRAGINFAELMMRQGPVSYTHLTLPTNREV